MEQMKDELAARGGAARRSLDSRYSNYSVNGVAAAGRRAWPSYNKTSSVWLYDPT